MRKNTMKVALFLALVSVSAWAEDGAVSRALDEAGSKVDKAVSKMGHALGAEKWHLKVLERDLKDRPTLERGMDDVNRIERRTTYHPNGKKASQDTFEFVGSSEVTSYVEKNQWDAAGRSILEYREDITFENGVQTHGEGHQKDFEHGRLVKEVKRRWTVDAKAWKDFYVQTVDYYSDGQMKERVTEEVDTNSKTRESWGTKRPDGKRNKSTQTWNGEEKRWD